MKYPTAEIELFSKRHVQLQNGHMLWAMLFFPIAWRYNTGFNEYNFEPLKVNYWNEDCEREGLWKTWYNHNGRIYSEGNYVNGERKGLWKHWYICGYLKCEHYWANDKMVGLSKWYSPSGKLTSLMNI